MSIARIEVKAKEASSVEQILYHAQSYLGFELDHALKTKVYKLKRHKEWEKGQLEMLAAEVFSDPVLENTCLQKEANQIDPQTKYVVEIGFRPGVTDNVGHSAQEAISLLLKEEPVEVSTGFYIELAGNIERAEVEALASELGNELLNSINVFSREEFEQQDRFTKVDFPEVKLTGTATAEVVNLNISDDELEELSRQQCLALTLNEMKFIKQFYESEQHRKRRSELGLSPEITDVELEVIAQSWSEHCKHKIFAADIDYSEDVPAGYPAIGNKQVQSLYKSYIKKVTKDVEQKRGIDWLISVFSDNAGIVRFDSKMDLCIKVETHNSPSALDPYGGALTGILGVNRDIMGVGLGGRPIANTDVFCFGPSDFPVPGEEEKLPLRLKHPRRILEGVHLGIEDGGNKSGIPTVNGAIVYDRDFSGKPLVFCGTVGVLPPKLKDGKESHIKYPHPGDRIIMAGGRIGADGIHGATFSSLELDENSPATAVQIGDPITQKRLLDFTIEARDLGLFSCVTDNGAGGLSSSVGEMATLTNGATIDLAKAPVKYPGLKPFELMISESQERMTFGVPTERLDAFMELAKRRGVEASDIGEFTESGHLLVHYENEIVADLNLHFLHESLLPMQLKAHWAGPQFPEDWTGAAPKKSLPASCGEILVELLGRPNIKSKENLVRRYDHEVQAATHIKPFVGKEAQGPGDSGVIWLAPHGGCEKSGVAIGCGLRPNLSHYDAYAMAAYAVDESVRNIVASGANPEKVALVDNFCWPDPVKSASTPDGEHKLGQLVRACQALYDVANVYGMPFVSGKDSMKNDFSGKFANEQKIKISIPPTLLVTAMGAVDDIGNTCTSDFKQAGDLIYLIGSLSPFLGASELEQVYAIDKSLDRPTPIDCAQNFATYQKIYEAHQGKILQSCHDISDGGALVCLAESMIGGELGATVDLSKLKLTELFSEINGSFIVSVSASKKENFEQLFKDLPSLYLGVVSSNQQLEMKTNSATETLSLDELKKRWLS